MSPVHAFPAKEHATAMKKIFIITLIIICAFTLFTCAPGKRGFSNGRFLVNGQELFMSGMNLAWINFGRDITEFNEAKFIQALEDIARKGGNCIRWWIHVNGSTSPIMDQKSGLIILPPGFQYTLAHALDLAWERGIMVVLCLWSFDMLKPGTSVNMDNNLRLFEDPAYTRKYVDGALRPLVKALKDHPAVLCWEIINEPEGVLTHGWTTTRTTLKSVQRFINLQAAGIHREDPEALVTVGSNVGMVANVKGMVNNYSDDKLIKAGGEKNGILDFYEFHYYPHSEGEMTSPFHHPVSYWNLDKPILIGEFPAFGMEDNGRGYAPKTKLTPEECYLFAYKNGYAGALSWTWTAHDGFGGVDDAGPGMLALQKEYPEHIVIQADVNRPPLTLKNIENLKVGLDTREVKPYVNVDDYFTDHEDGKALTYSVEVARPDVVSAEIDAGHNLNLRIPEGSSGVSKVNVTAEDSGGKKRTATFVVFVYDPDKGNLALFKSVASSGNESDLLGPEKAADGLEDTRWSSAWADNQWMTIDLANRFALKRIVINWETAYGLHYRILVSMDNKNWKPVYEQKQSDGKIDEIELKSVPARFVKFDGIKRATEWGFSMWEFEVYGTKLR
jgi:hypothetical protein